MDNTTNDPVIKIPTPVPATAKVTPKTDVLFILVCVALLVWAIASF